MVSVPRTWFDAILKVMKRAEIRGAHTRTRGENIFPEILDRQPKAIKKKSPENGSRTVWVFFGLHADFCLFDLNRPGQKSFRWPQFWFFPPCTPILSVLFSPPFTPLFCLFDLNRSGQKSFRRLQFWLFSTPHADFCMLFSPPCTPL